MGYTFQMSKKSDPKRQAQALFMLVAFMGPPAVVFAFVFFNSFPIASAVLVIFGVLALLTRMFSIYISSQEDKK